MNKLSLFKTAVAVSLLAVGTSAAQEATTTPVGYKKETLVADAFNLLAISLHQPVIVSGALEASSGGVDTITDSDVLFSNVITEPGIFLLEMTSGTAAGNVYEFVASDISGSDITFSADEPGTDGASANDTYQIRKATTITDLFGANNTLGLTSTSNSDTSDIIWVSDGSGGFDKYFYSQAFTQDFPPFATVPEGWYTTAGAPADDLPINYTNGLIIQRRAGGPLELTQTGEVNLNPTCVSVLSGAFNLVGTVFPVGTTLGSSGLETQVTQNTNSDLADILWLSDGTGGFARYYYTPEFTQDFPPFATVPEGWYTTSGTPSNDVLLEGAVFLQRRGPTSSVKFSPNFLNN